MFHWPAPTRNPTAGGVEHELEGDGIELQDLNPDAPVDIPAIPAVPLPLARPQSAESLPPSYRTLPEEDDSLKDSIARRLDGMFLLFLFLMGCCLQLDRVLFAVCRPYFVKRLDFTEEEYKFAAIFRECGYITAQIPSNFLLSRISKPTTYLCIMLCLWATAQIGLSYKDTPGGVYAYCALLGIFESAFFVGTPDLRKVYNLKPD
ncbi:hypothetical protein F4781DRAFT_445284 [Annulohypoxylon bovei var. microspora]|nr:hypothetical protein F4781DRAFT_445284 [Annulohypoxylon bovei var. microspora]